ncbi:MAG: hypothetical protein B6I22_08880 [Desulfobacteraceae bacterium 4572_123]|nr:MAG: hypothetical protein B6I22_08880 [Desulfobacteraceae bacterium 4572_123]
MSFEYDELSFGSYIKTRRLERAIPLEAISRKTHITVEMLLLLEKEVYADLPAQVYVKGFIREYAKVVGIDAEDAVRRYLADYKAYLKATTAKIGRFQFVTAIGPRMMIALVVLAAVIALSVGGVIFLPDKSPSGQNSSGTALPRNNAGNITASAGGTILKQPAGNKAVTPLTLDVTVSEKTWLKAIVDSGTPDVYYLVPQDRLVLQAVSGFNLLIGSATGVKLLLDGKPVKISGKSGQMVNIQLP